MKVMIDIPKEFESDLQDKFNEFFERVKCDINSSLESQEVSMCGNYERETAEMFLSAFEKATIIPNDATNGEVLEIMFPNCEVFEHKVKTNSQGEIVVGYDVFLYAYHPNKSDAGLGFGIRVFFDNMWWNAPYKKEVEEWRK